MTATHRFAVVALAGALIGLGVSGCKKAADYHNQGRAYVREKEYDRALQAFTRAIEKDPEFARAYFDRGLIYLYHHNRDRDRALSDFNKAIEINPKYGNAYVERAMVYLQKKEYDKARADVQQAESLGAQMNPGFVDAVRRGPARPGASGATRDGRP